MCFKIFSLIYLPVIASSWVDDLLPFYPNRSDFGSILMEGHLHRREQEPLVSGVEKIYTMLEDSIVNLALLLLDGSVDLGARSLFSGVGCNAPGFFPKLDFAGFSFCISMTSAPSHRIFLTIKIIFIKPYFVFLKLSENNFNRDSRLRFLKLIAKLNLQNKNKFERARE